VRDKVSVFYYPSEFPDQATLKKSILLFDELHFIDRPSFMFGDVGTIAAPSALRQFEQSFRDEGVPLYVHRPRDGPVQGDFLEQVKSDINDLEFLKQFQRGLENSIVFRDQQIHHGNYGEGGNHEDLARALIGVNVESIFAGKNAATLLLADKAIQHFRFKTDLERAKCLVQQAQTCSAMMNFALQVSEHQGMTPLADSVVYQNLLSTKYARAGNIMRERGSQIQLTDLGVAIFDELVPAERLEQMSLIDVVKYRKETEGPREAFLEHLAALQAKQGTIHDGDYRAAIENIIVGDIVPEARKFKNALDTVYEKLYGAVASGILVSAGSGAMLQVFGDMSWANLLKLAGAAGAGGAALATMSISAIVEYRAACRDCAISYILGLDR